MVKCDKTEEEVLEAFENFHKKNDNGDISKDDFLKYMEVIGGGKLISFYILMIQFYRTV